MESPEHERRDVVEYFEMEHGEAKVEHAEKVASERIFGRPHDVWDIRSTDGRWWVITNMTNLYKQDKFESMDYVLSFHIGLMARMGARQSNEAPVEDDERERLGATWRKWEQAAVAQNNADEAEDFQAVGVRCREALLSLIDLSADEGMVPEGSDAPKHGDFIHWSELVAETVASGSSAARIRAYLKKSAKVTWELVNWLTHAKDATPYHGNLAVEATSNVLGAYSSALLHYEDGPPQRCPKCSSYRVVADYRSAENKYVALCAACGWEEPEDSEDEPLVVA